MKIKLTLKLLAVLVLCCGMIFISSSKKVQASFDCETYWDCMRGCNGYAEYCMLVCGNQNCPTPTTDFCDQARSDAAYCQAWYGVPLHGTNPDADPELYAECMANSKVDLCQ